ncbi:hypothetical protein [Arthrobacter sp. N199823]|uniref:hypothetical protein n=1 Tax=Arthrobacter sp. N199823 TaxID=2058895 RepID=UPI000CE2F8BA|nr:hypothetical protein [Arthrobacter sp. N199823]
MASSRTHPGLVALFDALVGVGFRKRADEIFTLAFDDDDDALGWLGLNYASRAGIPGQLNMNPVCGVRIQSLERSVAEITGGKFHQYNPPTLSDPLHYLARPGVASNWVLFRDTPEANAVVIADIVNCVETAGLSYMRKRATLETMAQALVANEGHRWQTVVRAPVALWLLSRNEEATDYLNGQLAEFDNKPGEPYDGYRNFASTLKRRIAESAALR